MIIYISFLIWDPWLQVAAENKTQEMWKNYFSILLHRRTHNEWTHIFPKIIICQFQVNKENISIILPNGGEYLARSKIFHVQCNLTFFVFQIIIFWVDSIHSFFSSHQRHQPGNGKSSVPSRLITETQFPIEVLLASLDYWFLQHNRGLKIKCYTGGNHVKLGGHRPPPSLLALKAFPDPVSSPDQY